MASTSRAGATDTMPPMVWLVEVCMLMHVRLSFVLVLAFTLGAPAVRAQSAPAQAPQAQRDDSPRDSWQNVPEIFEAMGVRPGAVVADVGAGDGYLTVRLARAVSPGGRVIAVDISDRALERLRARVQKEGLANVDVVKGDPADPHLPASSLDAAVIVNSYHEMSEYQAMLQRLKDALKPDGRLVIVDQISEKRREASRAEQTKAHELATRFAELDAREAGFRIRRLEDPFASRRDDDDHVNWLLVAVPDPLVSARGAACPLPAKKPASPPPPPEPDDDAAAVANPDLRIPFDRFKTLLAEGTIVVVDVRTEGEFKAGHISGAIWIPLNRVGEQVAELRAKGKPIVAYCS